MKLVVARDKDVLQLGHMMEPAYRFEVSKLQGRSVDDKREMTTT